MNIGRSGHSALHVQLKFNDDMYEYYMPVLESNATEFALLGNNTPMTAAEIEKWKLADIAEIKSVVCEHDV